MVEASLIALIRSSLIVVRVVLCDFGWRMLMFHHLLQVLSQLLRKAKQRHLVLPNVRSQGTGPGEGFEGATVSLYLEKVWYLVLRYTHSVH